MPQLFKQLSSFFLSVELNLNKETYIIEMWLKPEYDLVYSIVTRMCLS